MSPFLLSFIGAFLGAAFAHSMLGKWVIDSIVREITERVDPSPDSRDRTVDGE